MARGGGFPGGAFDQKYQPWSRHYRMGNTGAGQKKMLVFSREAAPPDTALHAARAEARHITIPTTSAGRPQSKKPMPWLFVTASCAA